jgi:hypothetical protein
MKHLREDSECPAWDSNHAHLEQVWKLQTSSLGTDCLVFISKSCLAERRPAPPLSLSLLTNVATRKRSFGMHSPETNLPWHVTHEHDKRISTKDRPQAADSNYKHNRLFCRKREKYFYILPWFVVWWLTTTWNSRLANGLDTPDINQISCVPYRKSLCTRIDRMDQGWNTGDWNCKWGHVGVYFMLIPLQHQNLTTKSHPFPWGSSNAAELEGNH